MVGRWLCIPDLDSSPLIQADCLAPSSRDTSEQFVSSGDHLLAQCSGHESYSARAAHGRELYCI